MSTFERDQREGRQAVTELAKATYISAEYCRQVAEICADTQHYGAYSTRAASTSAALSCGVRVNVSLRAAGWSSESTFTRFYKKDPTVNMGQALQGSYLSKHKSK